MNIFVRTADSQTDYERIGMLYSVDSLEPVTADHVHGWDEFNPPGMIRRRAVAVDESRFIVGCSRTTHDPRDPEDTFNVYIIVDTLYRHNGVGTQLYDDAIAFAGQSGGTVFKTEVSENQPHGMTFAEKRGFVKTHLLFDSKLDIVSFDELAFAHVIQAVEKEGIHFSSLANEGDTLEARHKLYELNRQTTLDNPTNDGQDAFPDFAIFQAQVYDAAWFRADGQLLAIDRSQSERFIGLAAVGLETENVSIAYNAFTGVDRAYRGRGIAKALKLLAIRFARANGVETLYTDNHSLNAPMLAINHQFGYQALRGKWVMKTHS